MTTIPLALFRFTLLVAFAALAMSTPARIHAQPLAGNPPPSAPTARSGKIRGVVFDSLLMAPVNGATVTLMSRMQTVTADGQGRFSFDDVEVGKQTVVFESTELDSLGLGTMGTSINLAPQGSVDGRQRIILRVWRSNGRCNYQRRH